MTPSSEKPAVPHAVRRPRRITTSILLSCLMAVVPLAAQESPDLETRAAEAIQASQWEEAAELYGQLVEAKPEDATAWFRLGLATERSGGDRAAAREAYRRSIDLGFLAAPALVGISRTLVADDNNEAALAALEELAEQGPSSFVVSQLSADDSFAALADNETYQALIVRLTPCATEEYRQFDFWLGSWNVLSPQGQQVGTNEITETLDGCMLIERWTSASGGQEGMSMNYYDRDKGIWTQIFRDNSGNIAQWPELVGGIADGAMVLESAPDAQPRTRWTWTAEDDGRVRQMAESSSDGGETWTVVWDSYYERAD